MYPQNDEALVKTLGKLLDADLDTVFTLTNTDGKFLYFQFKFEMKLYSGMLIDINIRNDTISLLMNCNHDYYDNLLL